MKIAFAGAGSINKVHAQAARNLRLELVAVVNHIAESMAESGRRFGIVRQFEMAGRACYPRLPRALGIAYGILPIRAKVARFR